MAEYPKISIITASYNQGKFIEKTILSVLDQNYPNLEYIIIDGGSTDESVEVIKKYADRLAYWVSEKDNGQYDAINKGFAKSTGEILAFLNADDLYLPWTLNTIASIFKHRKEIDWVTSLVPLQINGEGIIASIGNINPISKRAFLEGYYIPFTPRPFGVVVQEGTFWRRNLWEKVGANLNLSRTLAADFDLWCQFLQYAEPYCIGSPLAVMTRHADQRSNSIDLYVKECQDSLDELRVKVKYSLEKDKNRKILNQFFRSNKYTWFVGKRVLDYSSLLVEPVLGQNYLTEWKTKTLNVYMK
jgi:glycosyltransferase involved in cell wall biosynthesis